TACSTLKGTVCYMGHLGSFHALILVGMPYGVEVGVGLAGMPYNQGSVAVASAFLMDSESLEADTVQGFSAPHRAQEQTVLASTPLACIRDCSSLREAYAQRFPRTTRRALPAAAC